MSRGVSVEDEADYSDGASEAKWDVHAQDAARAQHDDMMLAAINRLAVDGVPFAVTDEADDDSMDEGASSKSSQDERSRAREEKKALAVGELKEVAERVSRISAMQMANVYRKGRTVRSGMRMGSEVDQKVFGLEGTETLVELETAGGLYRRLMEGENVMAQFIARTGIGKTTKFGGILANKCGMRVLQLEPDVLLAKAAAQAQRDSVRVRDSWSKQRQAQLTVMTYADFCAQFYVKNGKLMLEQFDVVIMDEAHVPKAEVYATRAILATYHRPDMNLIVLSATMEGTDSQVVNAAPEPKALGGRLVEAVEAGKFSAGARCRDRTMMIVPTDAEAARCQQYLTKAGHVAYLLDSASRFSDCSTVRAALTKSSMVKRFLIVTESYGTGHNFPVVAVYTDASRQVYEFSEATREVVSRIVPVMNCEMKQHAARVGRGFVKDVGPTSYYFRGSGELLPDGELLESERLRAYLILRAAGIRPLAVMLPPRGFLPFGITPAVAAEVLAINMPCELAIRFFNQDGRLSANYARALTFFSQVHQYFVTSPLAGPIGHAEWERVPVGGYYGSEIADEVRVAVPFDVQDDELRTKLHAVCAVAEGKMSMVSWMPQLTDSEASGDEARVTVVQKGFRPRLVTIEDRPPVSPPKAEPWGFDAQIEGQYGFAGDRRALLGGDSYTQATLRMLSEVADTVVEFPTTPTRVFTDRRGTERVDLLSGASRTDVEASPIQVSTPGGTAVVTLRNNVWESLIQGEILRPDQFSSLLRGIRDNVAGFVRSTAFSNWSNVWLSVLRTCADMDCLTYVQLRAMTTTVTAMLNAMYVRYSNGVSSVTEASRVKAKFWRRIVNGRSFEQQLSHDKARGKIEIIQSELFFTRVVKIRSLTAIALQSMERQGIYMPTTVSNVQEVLPISTDTGQRDIDRARGTQVARVPLGRRRHSGSSVGWARNLF